MGVPMLDLKAQYAPIRAEIREAVERVFDNTAFILGKEVAAFEEALAAYCGTAHAVGVSSGTDAILACLMNEGIGQGDEVICPNFSFFATAGCISRTGAKPVFVDIEPVGYQVDPAKIEAAITPATKAIIPVHLYGQCADMDAIMAIAARHNLVVIEDAAQAIGAEYNGKRAGSMGHYGCFSFYPTKNLGAAGDGGAIVTNDAERANRLVATRNHGSFERYYHEFVGGNFRLAAIQAAVLAVKLAHLEGWHEGRRTAASRYATLFGEVGLSANTLGDRDAPSVVLPVELDGHRHIYHQYVLRVPTRDAAREILKARGIGHDVYYPVPFADQKCFADLGYQTGAFPESERAAAEVLALPIFPEITEEQQREVVTALVDGIVPTFA